MPPNLNISAKKKHFGPKIAVVNGCFDVLHAGHIHLFREARAISDRLIVLLNSDASVRKLKGPGRPANCESDRETVLRAIGDVSDVVIFGSEDELEEMILTIKPRFLVKGSDYRKSPQEKITGAKWLPNWGGELVFVDLLPGRSSSRVIGSGSGRGGA